MLFDKDGCLKSGISEDIILEIMNKEVLPGFICANCRGDKKISCYDAKCYVCAMDHYCKDALDCPRCVVPTEKQSSRMGTIHDTTPTKGVICAKCNTSNEYLETPNQADGSHLCYQCRSGS